ncbi:DUF2946 domain-containing protein [Stutzerimonas stutzeri]|uniref:DUF2946 domain-containing protein n=1 Tax=Stutzerimonas sp. S1 TaxID=3030652 RepID=UPI002224BDB7|nr:DUF2946 domain-containing protein [Stutzerimonas sp. S1]MCW3150451.1 DUF2946 domain-containing protein [Stutzerimonas sp. S1]
MRRRRSTAWIACLAMLLHVLAMPLAGSLSAETKRLLGWGGYCPLAQQLEHAGHAQVTADQEDSAPAAHHAGMPQCCCGAGFAGFAALPSAVPPLPDPRARLLARLPAEPALLPAPRHQWPALNPRASPTA